MDAALRASRLATRPVDDQGGRRFILDTDLRTVFLPRHKQARERSSQFTEEVVLTIDHPDRATQERFASMLKAEDAKSACWPPSGLPRTKGTWKPS